MKDEEEKPKLFDFLKTLQSQMTVIYHRMESISKVLSIPACECSTCEDFIGKPREKTPAVKEVEPTVAIQPSIIEAPSLPSISESMAASVGNEQENIFTTTDELNAQVKLLESLSNLQASTENFESLREEGKRGRKSKYCDEATKIVITNYAKQFGPSAAARKFNIPTAVASYYYRKATNSPKLSSFKSSSNEVESTKNNTSEDQSISLAQPVSQVPSSSPSFLRGRGRGRPKLIGDELDAALVDYIISAKKQNPHKHYTAGTIMDLSKEYIKKNAPKLLVEDGGSVNLKNTWAIKLLVRVAEREQELASNPNETFNPLSSLLNSFDANTTDLANIFNFVNQMSNATDIYAAATKKNSSNEENKDNAENEINEQAINGGECNQINDVALKTFLATFLTGTS
jgi:hypothetical protein